MTSFTNDLQMFSYLDKYSRFDYDLGRREFWPETVERTVNHLKWLVDVNTNRKFPQAFWDNIRLGIEDLSVMPSMRNLSMSGKAAQRQGLSSYNCAAVAIDSFNRFREAVTILISGTGLGYSVESRYINKFPAVKHQTDEIKTFVIPDTSEGWANAVYYGICNWWNGNNVEFNFDLIRPAGSVLKIKGGRASGPDVLRVSLNKIKEIILNRQGEKIRTLDVHDIMCYIAKCIVSGGVRRSAMLCLFDFDDELMKNCKSTESIIGNEQRWLSNNSIVIEERLDRNNMDNLVDGMIVTNMGEPGFFMRYALSNTKPERREDDDWITNACSEIIKKPSGSLCNLTSIVARPNDTYKELLQKSYLATVIGTIQSLELNLQGLSYQWVENAKYERLLGVDINNFMSCSAVRNKEVLMNLREYAVDVNKQLADYLGIEQSKAVTCLKPSGNSSSMLNVSPGIHTHWANYYIRRAQVQKGSPIARLVEDYAPNYIEPMIGNEDTTAILKFPMKAPKNAIARDDVTAIDQCNYWLLAKENYTEHNPSVTISYVENEVEDLKNWIYNHQDVMGGMAFLPRFDANYKQMPYETVNKEVYNELSRNMPKIPWNKLPDYETEDFTNASRTIACDSEKCEIRYE